MESYHLATGKKQKFIILNLLCICNWKPTICWIYVDVIWLMKIHCFVYNLDIYDAIEKLITFSWFIAVNFHINSTQIHTNIQSFHYDKSNFIVHKTSSQSCEFNDFAWFNLKILMYQSTNQYYSCQLITIYIFRMYV